MIVLAEADPLRMKRIWREVKVRDGLECYFRVLQREARENFKHEQSLFVAGGLKKAPKPPAILRMRTRKRRKPGPFKEPEKPDFLKKLEERER